MKVCILNGSPRGKDGNTYIMANKVITNLEEINACQIEYFDANKDFPPSCLGCYNCISGKGEEYCPHRDRIAPIEQSIINSDLIVLISPVLALDVSSSMKSLLDHLGYRYVVHRPHEGMRTKSALIVSSAAGSGIGRTIKTMALSLKYWGVPKIYKLGLPVFAFSYADMPDNKKQKYSRKAQKLAMKINKQVSRKEKQHFTLHNKFMKTIMKSMIKSYGDKNPDYIYWKERDWL